MLPFLRLIRLPNLLIMGFTMVMVRYAVLGAIIQLQNHDQTFTLYRMHFQMSEVDFLLLVLSVMLIGAAGYIINDYFDVRIDEVNRPDTNAIGKQIKRRWAMMFHHSFNVIGAGIGIWLSWKYHRDPYKFSGLFRLGTFLFISAPALLWFYSTNLKRQFLIGNLVIALLSGFVPLTVILFEIQNIHLAFPDEQGNYLSLVVNVTLVLALFAFVISLLRELIKDIEDYEGDLEYGCKTIPVVLGISKAKIIIIALIILLMGGLGFLQYRYADASDWSSFAYFLLLLQLPFIYLILRIRKANSRKDWKFASLFIKMVMLAGICYLFVFYHGIQLLLNTDAG